MELICLIKCLTELAFGVQREFKQEGRDVIRSVEAKKGSDCGCREKEGNKDNEKVEWL